MNPIPAPIRPEGDVWSRWDKERPCTDPVRDECVDPDGSDVWTNYLYERRSPSEEAPSNLPPSIMQITAFRKLKEIEYKLGNTITVSFRMDEAFQVALAHRYGEFPMLLTKREAQFSCRQFESYCKRNIRWYINKWAEKYLKEIGGLADRRVISGDAPLDPYDPSGGSIFDLIPDKASYPDLDREEFLVHIKRAYDDLPSGSRRAIPEVEIFLEKIATIEQSDCELSEPASSKDRKVRSRAVSDFRVLLTIHRHTESDEGRKRIQLAIQRIPENELNRTLAEEHLLDEKGLDRLAKKGEMADQVRYRFLKVARSIYPFFDPNRVRAISLLPEAEASIIRAAFFPPAEDLEVARILGWPRSSGRDLIEVVRRIRKALSMLACLSKRCEQASSHNCRSQEAIQSDAERLDGLEKCIFSDIFIRGMSPSDLVASYDLRENEIKIKLLNALNQISEA